jgi:hypothetical protein
MTGRRLNKYADMDEKNQWALFINSLRDVIPCDRCRNNFRDYVDRTPLSNILSMTFAERRAGLREWFYNLHLETPKIIPDVPTPALADLETMYSPSVIDIEAEVKCMRNNLQAAVNLGLIAGMTLFTFNQRLEYLKSCLI